jgi:hypothetical protein
MITTKEDALVEAMVRAVVAPSDTESDQATKLALEISRNMTIGEVEKCQQSAIRIIEMKKQLDTIVDKHFNKEKIH